MLSELEFKKSESLEPKPSKPSESTGLSNPPQGPLPALQAVADNPDLQNARANANPHHYYNLYDALYNVGALARDVTAPSLSAEEEAKHLETLQERLITLPYGAVTILQDKRLGQGAFGSVYEGLYQGQRVAIKEFNPTGVQLEAVEALQAFEWETSRLSTLSHSNLVRYYGVCRNEAGKLCIVMELCQGQHLGKQLTPLAPAPSAPATIDNGSPQDPYGPVVVPAEQEEPSVDIHNQPNSLGENGNNADASPYAPIVVPTDEELVKAPPRGPSLPDAPPIGWSRFWRIALDLAHGLSYLHAEGTLHRDLKSENVLLGLTGQAKLADLGVAQVDELVQSAEAKVVSRNLKDAGYAAPEEFSGQITAKSDMFSYGLVLCEMLQGKTLGNFFKRQKGELETIPEKCLSPIRVLIEQCWQKDPEARPTAQDAIRQLEACSADCGVAPQDRLLPRLEQLLEPQQSALRQYIPSFIEAAQATKNVPQPTIQEALQSFMNQDARVLAILGEGGLGKSLCTYQLAEQLLTAHRQGQPTWLPIFIRPGIAHWRHDALTDGLRTCLAYYGLSPSDIDGLRTQRFVFIFDGYDELSGNALGNLPATLNLADFPNAKLIISTRPMPDLLSALPQKLGFEGNCIVHTLQPFTPEQRLAFLQKTLFWDSLQQQWFAAQLAQAPDLAHSLQNPFVLHLFTQSWESQRKQNLSTLKKPEIYATFIRHWIETNAAFLSPPLHQALLGDKPLESAQDWLIQNAFAMARAHTLSLESINSPWTQPADLLNAYAAQQFQVRSDAIAAKKQALSQTQDPAEHKQLTQDLKALERRTLMTLPQYQALLLSRAKRFLDVAPLKSRNAQYQFIHKSLWEYCTALGVQRSLSAPLTQPALALRLGLTPKFLLQDTAMLSFLCALATPKDRAHWESWLLASRQGPQAAPVAACAMTALNGLQVHEPGYSFPPNLSGIRIPGANLQYATLSGVDFSHADLSQVQFAGAWLADASFAHACLRGVSFGEMPSLKLDSEVYSCAFSPDGRLLAVSAGKDIHVYEVETQKRMRTLTGHRDSVISVAFSPDGGRIVSGSGGGNIYGDDTSVRLWDVATGAELRALTGHTADVKSVAFSPDGGRIVSGSHDDSVRLWDAVTGAELQTLSGHDSQVNSVAFSPDGSRIISGSDDTSVRLWNAATGAELQKLSGHDSQVNSVAFSPDGSRIVSGSGSHLHSKDNSVRIWDAATGAELHALTGHRDRVNSVAFSPDGSRIVSGGGSRLNSKDNSIRLWDAATGAELRALTGHTADVNSVAFSPDGSRLISGSDDNSVRLWDAATGAELRALTGHTRQVNSVAFSPDGSRIVSGSGSEYGSQDNSVRLWEAATGAQLRALTGHNDYVNSVAFAPDGSRIVSGSGSHLHSKDNSVRIWDAATGAELRALTGHTKAVNSVAFSPDGSRIVSGSGNHGGCPDNSIRLWDAATGAELRRLTGRIPQVNSVAFSPDGSRIISGSKDNSIRLWDAATGAELRSLSEWCNSDINSVAFSPDGSRIISGSNDKSVRLWDAATGAELRAFTGHTAQVLSVAFSPDGRYIASVGGDGVCVYDASKVNLITKTNCGSVKSVSWSLHPDGLYLTTGHSDRSVRCWRLVHREHQAYLQMRWCQGVRLPLTLEGVQVEGAEGLSLMNAVLLKQRGAVGEPAPLRSSGPQEPEARALVKAPGENPRPVEQTKTTGGAVSCLSAEPEPRSLPLEMSAAKPRPLTWLADGLQGRASVARATAQPDAQAVNEVSAPNTAVPNAAPRKKYVVNVPARVRI